MATTVAVASSNTDHHSHSNGMCRTYSEVQKLCLSALRTPHKVDQAVVLSILNVLPQPKNTRRVGVIPEGQSFVYSQAAGFTTQRNARPALSSISSKCPLLLQVLAQFVLNYDPSFTFTTITINYNYAAAPHQDVNHIDGKARIIALGEFTGGELRIESIGDINIRNRWYDFDGRILHETLPFIGERYSLVYFSHIASLHANAEPIMRSLANLGIPCGVSGHPLSQEVGHSEQEQKASSEAVLHQYMIVESAASHTYKGAFGMEVTSLVSNHSTCCWLGDLFDVDGYCKHAVVHSTSEAIALHIAKQAITFTMWKVLGEAYSPEELQAFEFVYDKLVDAKYCSRIEIREERAKHRGAGSTVINVDVCSLNTPKLTSTQKRKLLVSANIWSKIEFCCSDKDRIIEEDDRNIGNRTKIQRNFCIFILPSSNDETPESDSASIPSKAEYFICEQLGSTTMQSKQQKKKSATAPQAATAMDDALAVVEDDCSDTGVSTLEIAGIDSDTKRVAATMLKPEHSRLLCNLARLQQYSLVYDPFCGGCSILDIAKKDYKCICIGSDANPTVFQSLSSSLMSSNCYLGNVYHLHSVRGAADRGMKVDAIVCDPPYGRREKHIDKYNNDFARHSTPEERARYHFNVLSPLLNLASDLLVVGGRLVFLFMNYPKNELAKWDPNELPLTPQLRLCGICSENWNFTTGHLLSREIVIIEKVTD